MTNLSHKIAECRRKQGLTQEQLAAQLGISAGAISKWENGNTTPDISLLAPLARVLHITLDELFDFHEKLSSEEVAKIKAEVRTCMLQEGFAKGEHLLNHYLKEYPSSLALKLCAGTLLFMHAPLAENADENFVNERYRIAVDLFQSVIDSNEVELMNSALFSKAHCLLQLKEYEECEMLLKTLNAQSIDAAAITLSLYEEQERYEDAKLSCRRLLFQELPKCCAYLSILARLSAKEEKLYLLNTLSQLEELFQFNQGNSQLALCHYALDENLDTAAHYFRNYIQQLCLLPDNYDQHPIFKGIRLDYSKDNLDTVKKMQLDALMNEDKYKKMQNCKDYQDAINLIKDFM